ncbi:putative exported protein [Acinetobacter guillouiae MSP4-18]|uniref:Uncharacterized protein n=1 Tax=Acinetobacter guillouiae TaxID=106649 RepID=A0A6A1RMU0_ACIGI|nr:hypothetical protein [Acinetobacter guillouiae]ENU57587.1 hypothetical protein F981_03565 [Acinetobacter guillouiae CIP 63.46]EPH34622.1 putative exported protein [Acinetobacter guillouiae MSP4-18]KAB0625075.1 hypothetical protein F7P82_16940 [Acinetobacter guillouiae]MCF0266515.1 hypothetical protein [Acinetobacter guillouiae]
MTQEKQTSIRILQSKPAKKTLGKSFVFLLGLIAGMVISAIFFFVFINMNPTESASTNTDSVATQEPELRDVHAEEAATNHHDENAGAYKQHINEKDFNQIFKHENKVAAQKNPNPNASPFEQMLKPEAKPAVPPPAATRPQAAITAKPVPKAKVEAKPEVAAKPTEKEAAPKKEEAQEASPEGTVKMTIDRKVIENKP